MGKTFSVKPYSSGGGMLIISGRTAKMYGLTNRKHGCVSFGNIKKYVDVYIAGRVDDHEIFLSDDVIEYLHIPAYPQFEMKVEGNEIVLGPCIGIIANKKDARITKRRLVKVGMSMLDYSEIHGAVIVFALDKVDMAKRLIEGYCYNPETNGWERGIYPYPLSLIKRTGVDDEMQDHFLSAIGDRIFNNYYFNKWKMYQWFSTEEHLLPHLPDTRELTSSVEILEMLKKFRKVYIKPIQGMKGFGVVRVSLEGGSIVFRYREDGVNEEITCKGKEETEKTFKKLFGSGKYIIQQGLDLISYNGGVVDFRCVMQKDDRAKWVCNGIVARTGAKQSVVSNISSGGFALPVEEMMKEALHMPQDEIFQLKDRMISLCTNVCNTLDGYGINYGTLGLDIGIDNEMRLWIIEINNRAPHPAIALRSNDLQSYYTILSYPLHYGKLLAGF